MKQRPVETTMHIATLDNGFFEVYSHLQFNELIFYVLELFNKSELLGNSHYRLERQETNSQIAVNSCICPIGTNSCKFQLKTWDVLMESLYIFKYEMYVKTS